MLHRRSQLLEVVTVHLSMWIRETPQVCLDREITENGRDLVESAQTGSFVSLS